MRRFVQSFTLEGLPQTLPPPLATALADAPERYNVAVRKPALVILDRGEGAAAEELIWGLIPSWSRQPETKYTTVTARVERAPDSRIYRSAWERRRCVVPMTGYYKWDRSSRPAWPYFIQSRSGEALFAAGLWDRWPADEPELHTFTVLTAPNAAIPAPLVPDGPVFLAADRVLEWLDGPRFPQRFLGSTRQPPLEAYPVSRAIRSRDLDDYTLLEPADPAGAMGGVEPPDDEEWIDEDE